MMKAEMPRAAIRVLMIVSLDSCESRALASRAKEFAPTRPTLPTQEAQACEVEAVGRIAFPQGKVAVGRLPFAIKNGRKRISEGCCGLGQPDHRKRKPATAASITTAQAGVFHISSATKEAEAIAMAIGDVMPSVKTGS